MMRPAAWMTAALLGLGTAGCGAMAPGRSSRPPGTTYQAASDDPRLPEGAVRRLTLTDLPGGCEIHARCGDLVGINCGFEADGPYYYVEASSGRIVEYCGGACMRGPSPDNPYCRSCPPVGWTCG
ncbi:hypothetical protein ACLESD_29605 [Pyxidicoccus sp. 3LFB2]